MRIEDRLFDKKMGEVRNSDQKVRKYLFSEIFYGHQAVSYEDFFQELFGLEGSKNFLEKNRQVHNLKISNRLLRSKSLKYIYIPGFICSVCVPFMGSLACDNGRHSRQLDQYGC